MVLEWGEETHHVQRRGWGQEGVPAGVHSLALFLAPELLTWLLGLFSLFVVWYSFS